MIYVNARFLTQELTGVQRFAEEICIELSKLRDDIVFLTPKNIVRHDIARKLNAKVIGHKTGHYWEQVELTRYLKKHGNNLLVNLGSSAPIRYNNQIVTHHDITYKRYPESFSFKFRVLYALLIPRMMGRCRHLVTVSEFSKREISAMYGYPEDKISVVYNAVSEKFKKDNQAIKENFILAVSSPNHHKNFHGLLKAYLIAKKNNEKIPPLKIIGSASSSFAKIKFNEFLDNNSDVEFIGRVTDNELVSLYQRAKVFVFPSLYEGFGIPPIEAQSCGCPVISSNAASMPEILQQSVLYFEPEDTQMISDTLEKIISDSELRESLTIKGSVNARRFSWAASAVKVNGIVNELLKG
ncbi:glycosyltransferase family 4 protein [Serratia marcescens]|uniref:glycosyltransferase family 4 protein n=1 Tax=Serratia marcescens TaxID=615 RepID=UPI000F7E90CB|nr:glycosyltransferase family 1 protein [Serratia marcescens]RTF46876.1 glycosyltransferase family 1 protein [Serratia marcescens]